MLDKFKYTDKEIDQLVDSMTILVDSREKCNDHLFTAWDSARVPIKYRKKALERGDYSFMLPMNEGLNIPRDLYFDKEIIVERKGSLEEISGNLTKERDRLEKELALAPPTKVLLIENASYSDICLGNYRTEYNKKAFLASLHAFWQRYNIPVFFMPDPKYSGIFIWNYFKSYLKEQLR